MGIGNLIKLRRTELGMSQEELAEKCGYANRSTISRIESGNRDVPVKQLKKIAAALGMDAEDLVVEAYKTALERQADAYEAGIYTLDDYAARSQRTKEDLAAVRRELSALEIRIRERSELVPRIMTLVETYRSLPTERKNQLLRELIAKVEIRKTSFGIKNDQDFDLVIFPRVGPF